MNGIVDIRMAPLAPRWSRSPPARFATSTPADNPVPLDIAAFCQATLICLAPRASARAASRTRTERGTCLADLARGKGNSSMLAAS